MQQLAEVMQGAERTQIIELARLGIFNSFMLFLICRRRFSIRTLKLEIILKPRITCNQSLLLSKVTMDGQTTQMTPSLLKKKTNYIFIVTNWFIIAYRTEADHYQSSNVSQIREQTVTRELTPIRGDILKERSIGYKKSIQIL